MKSQYIRQAFLDFFKDKDHKIVASAPIVNKNDPSLMFTNAGMNQFKDFFLGNEKPTSPRIADTQKCLRVSGKHNDLEEVGFDGYHHTMFEMLGNWSFGDYFKREAIDWAWEFLTEVLQVNPDLLYATVFEGDTDDNLNADVDAEDIWRQHLPSERILRAGKKDNFWEMGETGPCGPCSEIHIDLRSDAEKVRTSGADLVNMDHPEVIEIWNLVFIQYNRTFDGTLHPLPARHVDTGMGFERLSMVMQKKTSSYDTDVFTPYISWIAQKTGKKYERSYDPKNLKDVAFRVVADHLRAVVFPIADGQIPGNSGAGYVIRRILRRAVRYYYSFLDWKEPLLASLVPVMVEVMGEAFPEIVVQQDTIARVIEEEESSFLHTLEKGLMRLEQLTRDTVWVSGEDAFELYDTYGFPIDLTQLILGERGGGVDLKGFESALEQQKERSRADAKKEVHDWEVLSTGETQFVGYDRLAVEDARILRYRPFVQKGKERYHLVLDKNPFYAEGGGQVGDTGTLTAGGQIIDVVDTQRENDLFLLITNELPKRMDEGIMAKVDQERRKKIEANHSATHLLHAALKAVLGGHVQQKGSLVAEDGLRFDFSHFAKVSDEEIRAVETLVNAKVLANVSRGEERNLPIAQAKSAGATMLFGEKYGDHVRMITFDPAYSIELCGGCHVSQTGAIGLFKITSESSVAAGVRRVEAVTATGALEYVEGQLAQLHEISSLFHQNVNLPGQVSGVLEENKSLKKELDQWKHKSAGNIKTELSQHIRTMPKGNCLVARVDIDDAKLAKDLAYQMEQKHAPCIIVLGMLSNDKPQLLCRISESLIGDKLNAGVMVRSWAQEIKGGGGGQPFFATAGGGFAGGLDAALARAESDLKELLK